MLNLDKILIPRPRRLRTYGETVKLVSGGASRCYVDVKGDDPRIPEGAQMICARLACKQGRGNGYPITLLVDATHEKFDGIEKNEAYFIEVGTDGATLCGKDAAGAFYAAVTFCEMLYTEGEDVCVERAEILDYPDFARRGQFIECRYGTEFLSLQDWCDFIDYMAKMKFNTLTVGVYGCWEYQYDGTHVEYLYLPLSKYPQLKTPKNIKYYSVKEQRLVHNEDLLPTMFEKDYFGELVAYAKRKNVLVKPLFNSLGHNTLIPRMMPEIAAKREDGTPSGKGFCTQNEKTYEVMFDIYDEIIDKYLLPNGVYDIQIGLDEVGESARCKCEKCREREYPVLMVEYIIRLCKHLKAKGMKHIYIYHDMLYHHFNVVNEALRDRFVAEGIYDEVVLDWWTYEDPAHLFWDKPEGVNNIFHSVIKPDTGYFHWSIPSENNENIRACAKLAKSLGFEGMESYGSLAYCYDKNYLTLADVSWNHAGIDARVELDERYARRNYPADIKGAMQALAAMFEIMRDETGKSYINTLCRKLDYYFYGYRNKDGSLKDFPGGAYRLIREKEEYYLPYLANIKEKAGLAKAFFARAEMTPINREWLLTATQYEQMADEYLTLYELDKAYNGGETNAKTVITELERLIAAREALMLMGEETRLVANRYTYLRNMSVFRRFMLDLLHYFKTEVAQGRTPCFDVTDWTSVQSEAALFLR